MLNTSFLERIAEESQLRLLPIEAIIEKVKLQTGIDCSSSNFVFCASKESLIKALMEVKYGKEVPGNGG